jgi:hypothetical protein
MTMCLKTLQRIEIELDRSLNQVRNGIKTLQKDTAEVEIENNVPYSS